MKFNVRILLGLTASILLTTACKKENPQPQNQPDPIINTDPADSTSKVVIVLTGMENTDGKINIALYNSSSSFNDPEQAFREYFLPVSGTSMTITLDSIPAGTYAFGLFHDENDNAALDQNFLTIPTEGFAFSNNAMGNFGPPSYDEAKFTLPEKSTLTQTIALKFF